MIHRLKTSSDCCLVLWCSCFSDQIVVARSHVASENLFSRFRNTNSLSQLVQLFREWCLPTSLSFTPGINWDRLNQSCLETRLSYIVCPTQITISIPKLSVASYRLLSIPYSNAVHPVAGGKIHSLHGIRFDHALSSDYQFVTTKFNILHCFLETVPDTQVTTSILQHTPPHEPYSTSLLPNNR